MDYGFCKIRLVRYSGGTAGELHPFPYYPRSTAAAVRGTSSFSLIPAGYTTAAHAAILSLNFFLVLFATGYCSDKFYAKPLSDTG